MWWKVEVGTTSTAPSDREGSDRPIRPDRPPRTSLFGRRVFRDLWAGSLASSIGSSAGMLALIWLVFTETGSAFDVALLGVAGLVPRATFGLFSGTLADRFHRLRLMVLADGVRATALVLLAGTLALHGFSLGVVLAVVVVLGLGQSLFRPAINSFLPTAVPPEDLGTANGLMSVAQEVTTVIGSPLGGILIAAIGVAATLAVNGGTYLVSGLFVISASFAFARSRGPSGTMAHRADRPSFVRQFREGVDYLRGQRALLKLTLASFGANFFLSLFFTFLVVYVGRTLGQGALVFGALSAATAAGFGVGSLLVGPLKTDRRFGLWFAVPWGLGGVAILGLVLLHNVLTAGGFLFAIGLGGGLGNTTFFTGVQKVVPNELLGRYLSLDEVGSIAAGPAGQLGGGLIIAAAGIGWDFTIAAVGTALFSLGLVAFADVRALRPGPTTPAQPTGS